MQQIKIQKIKQNLQVEMYSLLKSNDDMPDQVNALLSQQQRHILADNSK